MALAISSTVKGMKLTFEKPPEFVKAFITEQGTKIPSSILEFILSIYAS